MLLEFSSFISIKYDMYIRYVYNIFSSKVQQSYCYTQMCNYREEFGFNISNQLNILVGYNLSFTRSLNSSLTWKKWINFSRLNVTKEFATSFSCLTLRAVNLLLWKKILSLNFFKNITVNRLSTLHRVFFMGRPTCPTKWDN